MFECRKIKSLYEITQFREFTLKNKYANQMIQYENLETAYTKLMESYKIELFTLKKCRERIHNLETYNEKLSTVNSKLAVRAALPFEELTPRCKEMSVFFEKMGISNILFEKLGSSEKRLQCLIEKSMSVKQELKELANSGNPVVKLGGAPIKRKMSLATTTRLNLMENSGIGANASLLNAFHNKFSNSNNRLPGYSSSAGSKGASLTPETKKRAFDDKKRISFFIKKE